MITKHLVQSSKDWKEFINLPWKIYVKDPHWVPPLKLMVQQTLDQKKNPFYKHAEIYPVLAIKDNHIVGRVLGIIDQHHNEYQKEKTAFFGFFESINDESVSQFLFDTVSIWAKEKGMTQLRGPMNPSTNHECGLLIQGFDDTPTFMMPYNPSYYIDLFEKYGLKKCKDLFAYIIDGRKITFSEVLQKHVEKLKDKGDVTFRTIDMKKFEQEVETILEIYNDAWEDNWGFVPMNSEEFRYMAKEMKAILDPELLLIAEVKNNPAAFALALPDINQVLKKISNGKLLPWGWLKFLWNLKGPGKIKTMNRCRILTFGVKKIYQPLGIGPLLYSEYFKRGPKLGYPVGEASWILEDNIPMNKALARMCGEKTKVYRIYEKNL
jgi:hypothetical protein